MTYRHPHRLVISVVALGLLGCATTSAPYVGQGPHPHITRGRPLALVDGIGWVLGVIPKILFLNWNFDNHHISERTEAALVRYLDSPNSATDGTWFSLNEYAPGRTLKRLVTNHKAAWPYRLLLGLPFTLVFDVLLPGRLFAGLVSGDSYNPYTDTVSIYSDISSVALHEAGHAHDFNTRRYKGTYAAIRLIPFVDLYQEFQASDEAINYLIETKQREEEFDAYKILYPAYGSYVGSHFFPPIGMLVGIGLGHVFGHTKAWERREFYRDFDARHTASAGVRRSLVEDARQRGAVEAPQDRSDATALTLRLAEAGTS